MSNVSFESVNIENGFWKRQQDINRETTVWAVYDRFKESGRFDALNCSWKEGEPNEPNIFWDSDVAKWLEGAAYLLQKKPDKRLEELVDKMIDQIAAAQQENGYFNSHFIAVEPDAVFMRRMDHELYCAGHLIEGAIAYDHATGKRKLLDVMLKYVALIDRIFRVERQAGFDTSGHEEIELALFRLFNETGNEDDLALLRFFINQRGRSVKDGNGPFSAEYTQSHLPVAQQFEAVGHCVRAMYLYCGMLDLAGVDNDPLLKNACRALFDDIVTKKMYITGGIGSTHAGEAFTYAYDLPDASAYNETCASISLAMFCRRLWNVWPEGRFADVAEQAIYNTVLAGLSLSGDRFFYENPLAANARQIAFYQSRPAAERLRLPIIERVRLFDCSCCPPNLVRFVASIGDYLYSFDDNTIYTHLYMDSTASFDFHGQEIQIVQQTDYPLNGNIKLTVNTAGNGRFRMGVRIPGWCKTAEIRRNQHPVNFMVERGYAVLAADWKDGDCLDIILPMEVRFLEASPECRDYCGRLAVCRGPFVYCAEGVDYKDENVNVRDLRLLRNGNFDVQLENMQQHRLPIIYTKGTARKANGKLYEDVGFTREAVDVRLIPYFSWANRGANDMTVWLLEGNGG